MQELYLLVASSPPTVCVPLLLPLLTLMERPSITPEGVELWETSDQGCDIMLRHLEAARDVAHNSHDYTANAEKILQGKQTNQKKMSSPAADAFIFLQHSDLTSRSCRAQTFSATRNYWRCSRRTFNCGCCGGVEELLSISRIATANSTLSSLRCHGNWSRRPKHKP